MLHKKGAVAGLSGTGAHGLMQRQQLDAAVGVKFKAATDSKAGNAANGAAGVQCAVAVLTVSTIVTSNACDLGTRDHCC